MKNNKIAKDFNIEEFRKDIQNRQTLINSLIPKIQKLPNYNEPIHLTPVNVIAMIDSLIETRRSDEDNNMIAVLTTFEANGKIDCISSEQQILFFKALKMLNIKCSVKEQGTYTYCVSNEQVLECDEIHIKLDCTMEFFDAIVQFGSEIPDGVF